MRTKSLRCLMLSVSLFGFEVAAQNYSVDWFKIAGGGGTSSNGQFALTGTMGQADAGAAMSGGNYSVTGGFWALLRVEQTPGAPHLYIADSGGAVTVFWQNVGSWALQQNSNLALANGWSTSSGVTTVNGTNYLTIPNPTGSQFFRLK